ncbi:MAG: hypothetical protein IT357_03705 [Gemmatimonadaceae bacterium]|nr:hypothetical protein [Gemmatimonadaceae bacterium]
MSTVIGFRFDRSSSALGRALGLALCIGAAVVPEAVRAQGAPAPAAATTVRLVPMRIAPDTVLLYLLGELPRSGTVTITRGAAGTDTVATMRLASFVAPNDLRTALGDGYDALRRSLRAADEVELARRVSMDAFSQTMTTLVSRPAATVLGRLVIDAAAPRGVEVVYRVQISRAGGAAADRERTLTGRAPAVDAGVRTIPVPTRLRLEANAVRLRLTWAETRAADELHVAYHVYRRIGAGREERITEMPVVRLDARVPFFEDREVQQGATYRYTVRAVDLAGREGAASLPESLTVRDRSAPDQPRDLVAVNEIGRVRVSWAPSTSPDVAGYVIERAPGLNKRYVRLTPRAIPRDSLVYVDSAVPLREQHFWRIIAIDSAGNASTPSSSATGLAEDNVPPPPPTNVTARAVQRRLVINWTPVAARDLRGYHIYRGDDSTRMVRLTRVPFVGRSFIDSTTDGRGLRPGGGYTVRVSSVDSTLNESAPVTVRVFVPDDEAPDPPSGFSARDEQGRYMELTWSASPSPDVRWYVITRRDSAAVRAADSVLIARVDGRTGSPWSLRDTLPKVHGRTYLYAATPIDTAGNVGKPAIARMSFAEKVAPPSVRFAAATLLPNGAGVRVRWERVVDRELAGYHVYRSKIPTGNFERRTARPVNVLEFLDAGADGTWWYVVRAVDASGNESSASRPVRGLP